MLLKSIDAIRKELAALWTAAAIAAAFTPKRGFGAAHGEKPRFWSDDAQLRWAK